MAEMLLHARETCARPAQLKPLLAKAESIANTHAVNCTNTATIESFEISRITTNAEGSGPDYPYRRL